MSIDNFWMTKREYNPEEAYFAEKEKGKHSCMCKCRHKEHERRERECKAREHADIIDKLRLDAFLGKRMYDWKFKNSYEDVQQIEVTKKYVDTWLEMEQRKIFYGGLHC